jgi:hypothetical protein
VIVVRHAALPVVALGVFGTVKPKLRHDQPRLLAAKTDGLLRPLIALQRASTELR